MTGGMKESGGCACPSAVAVVRMCFMEFLGARWTLMIDEGSEAGPGRPPPPVYPYRTDGGGAIGQRHVRGGDGGDQCEGGGDGVVAAAPAVAATATTVIVALPRGVQAKRHIRYCCRRWQPINRGTPPHWCAPQTPCRW